MYVFRCPDIKVKDRLIRGPIGEIPEGFSTSLKVFRVGGGSIASFDSFLV